VGQGWHPAHVEHEAGIALCRGHGDRHTESVSSTATPTTSPACPGRSRTPTPRWLRLTRAGDTLTGYGSPNGRTWTQIGTTHLAGLPATVTVGLFVTSPVSFQGSSGGAPTQANATFDHITLNGNTTTDTWQSHSIGTGPRDYYPTLGAGSTHRSCNTFLLSGSGDIAPAVNLAGGDTASSSLLLGLIVGLIVVIVVATMFITVEYRRGLIRTTFAAIPSRGRVLAAKAAIIGGVTFVSGAVTAAVAVPLGEHILRGTATTSSPPALSPSYGSSPAAEHWSPSPRSPCSPSARSREGAPAP
jgi:hypothetical protein